LSFPAVATTVGRTVPLDDIQGTFLVLHEPNGY